MSVLAQYHHTLLLKVMITTFWMGFIHQAKAVINTQALSRSVGVTATAFGDGDYQHQSHNSKAKGCYQVETLAENVEQWKIPTSCSP